jgi:hypothetical protein
VMLLANALFDPARLALALVGGLPALKLAPNRLTC